MRGVMTVSSATGVRSKGVVLAAMIFAVAMIFIDQTIVSIAVPTLITGVYGMNVPYPGFDKPWGVVAAFGIMAVGVAVLYVVFKRKDWL